MKVYVSGYDDNIVLENATNPIRIIDYLCAHLIQVMVLMVKKWATCIKKLYLNQTSQTEVIYLLT